MLHHQLVLIAEDQPFIALDLAFAIEDAGGTVLGPASRVEEVLDLLVNHRIAGALLDVNLIDGDIWPVVTFLTQTAVPFIIQTGVCVSAEIAENFPGLIVHIKPNVAAHLVAELEVLMGNGLRAQFASFSS